MDKSEDKLQPTLLHIAAENNLLHVAKSLVEHYPGLIYLRTKVDDSDPIRTKSLPVELALLKFKDDTASYLICRMKHDRYSLLLNGLCIVSCETVS